MLASLAKWLVIRIGVWRGWISAEIAAAEGYEPAWFRTYDYLNEGVGGAIEAAILMAIGQLLGSAEWGLVVYTATSLAYERWLDHWGWNPADVMWRQVGATLVAAWWL